ncbi:MAG: hypothetical protein C0423_18950 [Methylibium sp.]|nr:hypothetical protein [Methylibium sp.]
MHQQQYPASAASVDALQALYDQGSFTELLPRLQQWLAGSATADRAARLRAGVLQLRCLAKLEQWEALAREGNAMLLQPDLASHEAAMDTLILLSYGELQLGDAEMSLSAAFAALQLSLQRRSYAHSAQALDRLAMSYLWLGDAALAERYLLEAIGYCHQLGDADTSLLRYSNGLVLLITLYDALRAAARHDEAQALAQRMQRFVVQGSKIEHQARRHYERRIWAANLARWQCRREDSGAHRQLLLAQLAEAEARGWGNIRRTLRLDLARFDCAAARWDEALLHLQQMNEPQQVPMRLLHALSQQRLLAEVLDAMGQAEQAEQARQRLQSLQQQEQAAVEQARRALPELPHAIARLQSQADQEHINAEMQRLRQAKARGEALTLNRG